MLRRSFPLEPIRPLLKQLRGFIKASPFIIHTAVIIRWQFGSFGNFWSVLTHVPSEPLYTPGQGPFLVRMFAVTALQYAGLYAEWWLYKLKVSTSGDPASVPQIGDILRLLPTSCTLPAIRWAWKVLHSKRLRKEQWSFKYTVGAMNLIVSMFGIIKITGLLGVWMLLQVPLVYDLTIVSILLQTYAACGLGAFSSRDRKFSYRYRPRFAWAALSQLGVGIVIGLSFMFGSTRMGYAVMLLPFSATGLLLLGQLPGEEVEYLAQPLLVPTEDAAKRFCAVCENTIFAALRADNAGVPTKDGATHHWRARNLLRSAQEGCRICNAVWQSRVKIPADFRGVLKFWKPATVFDFIGYDVDIISTQYWNKYEFPCKISILQIADGWTGNGHHMDIKSFYGHKKLSNHTGSPSSLQTAREWVDTCDSEHDECCASKTRNFVPTRLLYIGGSTTESKDICLHTKNKDGLTPSTSYMTLSHCWGKDTIIKLQERLEDRFRTAIYWEELSQTFRDAITIARFLGASYIWIDSLCIIQDSPEDWKHEAALMGQVYRNSHLNICASDAASGREGCLYPRNPRLIQPELVNLCSLDKHLEGYVVTETDFFDHVLYTRAWVLQECLLARRTLDCGRGQLFWRCGKVRASEVFPKFVPAGVFYERHPVEKFKPYPTSRKQVILHARIIEQFLSRADSRALVSAGPESRVIDPYTDTPFAMWRHAVEQFADMSLTVKNDRMVAFNGIVDLFRPFFGEYLAGHWKVFMPLELLWEIQGVGTRPNKPRAPSWSWLSIDAPVGFGNCGYRYGRDSLLVEFLGAEKQAQGYESIEHVHLKLSGKLVKAKWTGKWNKPWKCWIRSVNGQTTRMRWKGIPTLEEVYGSIRFDELGEGEPDEEVWCMPVQINKHFSYSTRLMGIVLREVRDDVFERVGTFEDQREYIEPVLRDVEVREITLV